MRSSRKNIKKMGTGAVFAVLCGTLLLLFNNCSAPTAATSSTPAPAATPNLSKLTPSCFHASSSTPVLTGSSLLTGADWNDPSVLKVGNQYVMYASSDKSFDFNISIYRLTSSDGATWALSPSTPVLQANPTGGAWDHRAVETPSVVFFNNQYHMFYTGYPVTYTDSTTYKIGHAVSSDGITFTKDASFILAPTNPSGAPNLDFNQFIVAEPGAVVFQNKIYLYFAAEGANAGVATTLQVIGLSTSSDGTTWSTPQSVLEPDQSIYPRATWLGYSTPQPVVINNQVHLFYDVIQASPWKQIRVHHASSANGVSGWTQDSAAIYSKSDFTWTSSEIAAPAPLIDGTNLLLWFAGNNGTALGIGLSQCSL
jgi:predicted GH43/DUF377 family glycosyl hydrolase